MIDIKPIIGAILVLITVACGVLAYYLRKDDVRGKIILGMGITLGSIMVSIMLDYHIK